MKLGIASAILCTALLASLCQAIPSPEYWSYKIFLDQLEGQDAIQQDHHIGSDVEALIEQSKIMHAVLKIVSAWYLLVHNSADLHATCMQR